MERVAAILIVLVAGLSTGAAPAAPPDPKPIAGTALDTDTGLRLLVADTAPFVLDVDSGRTARVAGIRDWGGVLWVVDVGGRGGVVVQRALGELFGVRGGSPPSRLGRGAEAWPAADGRSAWIQATPSRGRCTLRRVALDGRMLQRARPFPCATPSDPAGGSAGLVVNRTRVVDPVSGRTVRRTRWGIVAVAGRTLVLSGPSDSLTLLDAVTGAERRLARPDTLRGPGRAAVDSSGRYVALEFADPAWQGYRDTGARRLAARHPNGRVQPAPGMPAAVALKFTDMAWTADGRLVLLGEDDRGGFVAVWRPAAGAARREARSPPAAQERQRLVRDPPLTAPAPVRPPR